jgi:2-amino-4-hydroxy-6-hydroxymethyldihydropteridine diphosphokinase
MNKSHQIYLGIGSNINRNFHIEMAISELKSHFGKLIVSPVYESPAVGFKGDNFYNLVACLESNLSLNEINNIIKIIEDKSGRDRTQAKFSARTLDIDLLLFDDQVLHSQGINIPRDEILKHAFVLKPLYDIAPNLIHPETQQDIKSYWLQFQQKNDVELSKRQNFSL